MRMEAANKRKLGDISPNATASTQNSKKKSKEMTYISMQELQATLESMLEPLAKRDDVRAVVDELKALREENVSLNNKVETLTKRCDKLESQVSELYKWKTEKNLIIRMNKGINSEEDKKRAIEMCTMLAKSKNSIIGTNNLRVINTHINNKKCLLVATFNEVEYANLVLRNARELKGTDVSISKDYPKEIREKRAYLFKVRRLILTKSEAKPIVRGQYLIDGDVKFGWHLDEGIYLEKGQALEVELMKYNISVEDIKSWSQSEKRTGNMGGINEGASSSRFL